MYRDRLRIKPPAIYNHARFRERPIPNIESDDENENVLIQNEENNAFNDLPIPDNAIDENEHLVLLENEENGILHEEQNNANDEDDHLNLPDIENRENVNASQDEENFMVAQQIEQIFVANESNNSFNVTVKEELDPIGMNETDEAELNRILVERIAPNCNDSFQSIDENDGGSVTECSVNENESDDLNKTQSAIHTEVQSGVNHLTANHPNNEMEIHNDHVNNNSSFSTESDCDFICWLGPTPMPKKYCTEDVLTKHENDLISGKLPFSTKVKFRFWIQLQRF